MTSQLVATGVVTACCGGHRPASDCTCCPECPTSWGLDGQSRDLRAALAQDEREHRTSLRLTARRAEQLVTVAAIDESLADWRAALAGAVGLAVLDYSGHHPVPA